MLKFFIYYLCGIIAFILIVNFGFPEPSFPKKSALINPSFENTFPNKTNDTLSLSHTVEILNQHFCKPYFQESEGALIYRDDLAADKYFQNYNSSSSDSVKDIGCLGLMIINYRIDLFELSHKYEHALKNKDIPYYHYYKGLLLLRQGYHKEGVEALQEELKYKVYNDSVYARLVTFYSGTKNHDALLALYEKPEVRKVFPSTVKKDMYLLSGDILSYIDVRFLKFNIDWKNFTAALLITLVWFFYVVQLKIFLPKRWLDYAIILILGYFLSESCLILYDFYRLVLHWNLNGDVINDFFYCILGIGVIEEFIKLLPVILYLSLTKKQNEPIDYIIICSISALGFSFSEDFDYFRIYNDSMDIIHYRGINCLHLLCSGIAAYGIIMAKYKNKGIGQIILYFFIAAICHGLYDLWLINNSLYLFYFYSYVIVFIGLYFFRIYSNNALNISPYFDASKKLSSEYLKQYLIMGMTAIFLLQYFLNAVFEGPGTANDFLMEAMISLIIFLAVQASTLTNFDLIYDYVISPFNSRRTIHDSLIGKNILFSFENFIYHATVESREVFNNSPDFLIIKMQNSIMINQVTSEYLVLQIRSYETKKNFSISYKGALYLLDPTLDLNSTDKKLPAKAVTMISFSKEEKNEETPLLTKNNKAYVAIMLAYVFLGLLLFYNYMEFKSATNAYYWAQGWLPSKNMYKASENLLYAIQRRPSYTRAYLLMAKIELSLNQYNAAGKNIQKALEISPDNLNAHYIQGILFLRSPLHSDDFYKQAASAFFKVRQSPEAPDSTYYYEAIARMNGNEYKYANQLLDTFALRTKTSSFDTNFNKGLCNYHIEQYSEAEKLFRKSAQIRPAYYETYHYIGLCELERKDTMAACMSLSKSYLHNISKSEQYIQTVCNHIIYPEVDSSTTK
jgi:RsiW-degrading membrane proteinase PrsW (M82 family)/Tfp pilus assembly protein PilF